MAPRNLVTALVAGIALAAGVFVALRHSTPAEPQAAFVLPTPESIPSLNLLDHDGAAFTAESFKGQWDVVFFGFTSCPDICPTTLQTLAAAKQQLIDDGLAPLPRIVLVSVDPERDTPELLGQYVDYFGDGNVGVTGELGEIQKLAKALYVFFQRVELDDGNYTVDHSPAVLVIDPEGFYHSGFGGNQSAASYAADLRILMDAG